VRRLKSVGLVLALLAGVSIGVMQGCSFLDEDPPGRKCASNPDCFLAQGESCNLSTGLCEPGAVVDGGTGGDR